jgi:uncharacterized membrane protein
VRLAELLDLVFRWAHLIAGIMWIGNSMLFNWIDRNLIGPPPGDEHRLSQGKIYMVHSGAFYEVEKKLLEPNQLPAQLHWFKWQNAITWMTGIALLVLVYFLHAEGMLVDTTVRKLEPWQAIAISVGSLIAGWAIYDVVWRVLGHQKHLAHALSLALLLVAAYGYTEVFYGRAAYIMTGVLIGTIMTGNVWMVIVPSQRSLIAATKAGKPQDAVLSRRAKDRSIHNNYLTFPLLFLMLSNHFDWTWNDHLRWVILLIVMVGGAGVRHFMNERYAGKPWLAPAIGTAVLAMIALASVKQVEHAPAAAPVPEHGVDFARAEEIIVLRCVPCHSATPSNPVGAAVTNAAFFDDGEKIGRFAPKMLERLLNGSMPMNNMTQMTDVERGELAQWLRDGAKRP